MILTNYCLVARLTKTKLPDSLKFFALDPEAEIFDLAEGKTIVIADNKRLGNYENMPRLILMPTSTSPNYCMVLVGETEKEEISQDCKYLATASTREELYDMYAGMYANGVFSEKSSKYLPQITAYIKKQFSKDNVK